MNSIHYIREGENSSMKMKTLLLSCKLHTQIDTNHDITRTATVSTLQALNSTTGDILWHKPLSGIAYPFYIVFVKRKKKNMKI